MSVIDHDQLAVRTILEPLLVGLMSLAFASLVLLAGTSLALGGAGGTGDDRTAWREAAAEAARQLHAAHDAAGPGEAHRIDRGVAQVLRAWRPVDGDPAALRAFIQEEFLPRGESYDATFDRLEFAFERIGGYLTSMERDLRRAVDLDVGPILPVDRILSAYSPRAHVTEDLFGNKLAFVVLLNFPVTTLEERTSDGGSWSRRAWAETRLAQQFSSRVPADVNQRIAEAFAQADTYISGYNIYMHHLVDDTGRRLFPEGLRLITHWGLRDELKARYADPDGLARQQIIQKVMERIVRQEIPAIAIDNPLVDWNPYANTVTVSDVKDTPAPEGRRAAADTAREPDERYRRWIAIFDAVRAEDPYHPDDPTFIDRRFNVDREIPEKQVEQLFESVLASPLGPRVASLIARRLGRPLEPFDIWYAGFKPRGRYSETQLDARTRERYPTAEAYAKDMPRMFRELGFTDRQADFLAGHITVDPSRGAGHALGATRRDDDAHLRTRVGPGGMDYKGYNIAVHEMGHNVEQVFSVTSIDHTLLQGVPNTAFTEALAFVFQSRDLDLLGLAGPDADSEDLEALETFWATREIAAVALVDMGAWRWLYAHPDASPAAFREAVVSIALDVWNRHFAAIFGVKDVPILAVYSHMIDAGLYLPDYPLGHLIAFQIESHFRKGAALGPEFERICRLGSITPDVWMRQAVGGPLSAQPMLEAAARAVESLE